MTHTAATRYTAMFQLRYAHHGPRWIELHTTSPNPRWLRPRTQRLSHSARCARCGRSDWPALP
jgi:hypothetical protein